MNYRKLRKIAFWFVSLNIVFGAFQNCAPMHSPMGTSQSQGSSFGGASDDFAAQKFSETLQPILRVNCGACHGSFQVPQFAVTDPRAGFATIKQFQLVDIANPGNSYFLTKIRSGHNGFTETEAQEILNGINMWASALAAPADQQNPGVVLSQPAAAATVSGSITLTALATDNVGVASVQFYVDGVPAGAADTTSPYSVVFNTLTLANGIHSITATATDTSGNTGSSAPTNVTVMNAPSTDTVAPTVALTAPANGASVSGSVMVTATASDNVAVVGVQLLVNGVASGAEDITAPYSITWTTTSLANGSYTLAARARDAAGNMTTSATRTVTVANGGNPNATFTWISQNILSTRCTSCHGAVKADKGIRYNTYANTKLTVVDGNPGASPLYIFTQNNSMPVGGARLSAVQLQAISDWITAGAPNN